VKKALIIQQDIIILKIMERLMQLNSYDCKAIRNVSDLEIEDQTQNFDVIISEILFDGIAPSDFVYRSRRSFFINPLLS